MFFFGCCWKPSRQNRRSQIHHTTMTETKTAANPATQNVLLLHGPRQAYEETTGYAIPAQTTDREVLVRTETLGLNPIDWTAP